MRYVAISLLLTGLKFYSKDGVVVLQSGDVWNATDVSLKTHTVHLEDGERVIGY